MGVAAAPPQAYRQHGKTASQCKQAGTGSAAGPRSAHASAAPTSAAVNMGCQAIVLVLTAVLAVRTACLDGYEGLAFTGSSHATLAQALALLAACRPRLFARHREALAAGGLLCLCGAQATRNLALYGTSHLPNFHGGSALCLLGLTVLASSAAWLPFLFPRGRRWKVRWTALVLPAMAAVPLVTQRSMCGLQVVDADVALVLSAAYKALNFLHLPTAWATRLLTWCSGSALHQCMSLDAWAQLMLGVLLPLTLLRSLEKGAACALQTQLQQQECPQQLQQQHTHRQRRHLATAPPAAAAAGGSGGQGQEDWEAAAAEEYRDRRQRQNVGEQGEAPERGPATAACCDDDVAAGAPWPAHWLLDLYLASSLAWCAANALPLWL